eukprot:TRINITY_DN6304_c1_g2_i1.p1 TRINITY_DN6304_c1_g2~~TRINITY_DN6304_c1_g2_i1.p1  ORF type:complete len:628 (-),score=142.47 TRINITY_DN6304_c1_g2_i1:69-1952(-)
MPRRRPAKQCCSWWQVSVSFLIVFAFLGFRTLRKGLPVSRESLQKMLARNMASQADPAQVPQGYRQSSAALHRATPADAGASVSAGSTVRRESAVVEQAKAAAPVTKAPAPVSSEVVSPEEAERRCAKQCKEQLYCCNDIKQGSNQLLSCAQACMVRYRGGLDAAACSEHCGVNECDFKIGGFTYFACGVCDDMTENEECTAGGVGSPRGCEDGCMMDVGRTASANAGGAGGGVAPQDSAVPPGGMKLAAPFDFNFGRLRWWALNPAGNAEIPDKYVIFDNDAGGPNNIRIGWEMTAIVARATGRTFVLPPAEKMYLLDFGPMNLKHRKGVKEGTKTKVEDLINLPQLRTVLPTLTFSEFTQRTGLTWRKARAQAKQIHQEYVCLLFRYKQLDDRILFMQGGNPRREGFGCGEWFSKGAPKAEMRNHMQERDWALLTHGFVWHPDAFRVAKPVIDYLGLFKYVALHARYNDFQYKDVRQPADKILEGMSTMPSFDTLYVASDEPEKFMGLGEKYKKRIVTFDQLFAGNDDIAQEMQAVKTQLGAERWFKMLGPAEELICTFARVFVGSAQSSFSGHIHRMRVHAGAPTTHMYVHTQPYKFHKATKEVEQWEARGAFSPKPLLEGDRF